MALGQAWTKGKLQGEEALQLLERGVPVWDYLAKASKEMGHNNGLGYTNEQLQKMASNGDLTRKAIQSLIDQMAKQSQGAAKAQMNSWNGMISNMGDTWTLFKADVMESGTFDVLKGELSGLMAKIEEMKKSGEYDKLVDETGHNLVEVFRAAAGAIKDAKEMGEELIPVLKKIGETADGVAGMVGGYENLAKILGSIYLLNKGASFLAPAAKGGFAVGKGVYTAGSWAAGKMFGKGKGQSPMPNPTDAFTSLGATPVYVVNMPGGGMGGGMGPGDMPGTEPTKGGKGSKLKAGFGKVLAGTLFYPAVDYAADLAIGDTAFGQWAKNTTLGDVGDSAWNMLSRDGVSATARPDNLAASLDITMHYDRPPTVRTRDTAPGLKVNVDTGPSLMP